VLHVEEETAKARPEFETREGEFVDGYGGKPAQRHPQRMVMEQRNAKQRYGKENEIDGNAEKVERFRRRRGGRRKRRLDRQGEEG
jgi:hypothetical protein